MPKRPNSPDLLSRSQQRLVHRHWTTIIYGLRLAIDQEQTYADATEEAEPTWAKRARANARKFYRLRKRMIAMNPKFSGA